jgi:hypothetical protein
METDLTRSIAAWFAEHADEGEFACGIEAVPFSLIAPKSGDGRMIFTTKPALVSTALKKHGASERFGVIGRYGLPSERDMHWICHAVGPRAFLFLGDMDPADLLVFAWLRASLQPKQIEYVGVNDSFLSALHVAPTELPVIPLAASEQASLVLLEKAFPDFRDAVGHQCAQMLDDGYKLELEGVVSAGGSIGLL